MPIDVKLLEFFEPRLGKPKMALTTQPEIENSFGIVELDTILFYTEFVAYFNIQTPSDWNISNHVNPVSFHNWKYYWKKLTSRTFRQENRYRDLTVGELERMIENGHWQSA